MTADRPVFSAASCNLQLFELQIPPDTDLGETEPSIQYVCGDCWSSAHALFVKFAQVLVDAIAELQVWKDEQEAQQYLDFVTELHSVDDKN